MRGLAALVVLLHHCFRSTEAGPVAGLLAERVFNAHAAVVLFFVLSGYVLTRSLLGPEVGEWRQIGVYYVKRAFRIYPALWFGVGLGLVYFLVASQWPAPRATPWLTSYYQQSEFSFLAAASSFLGAGLFLLPTLWTITIELAASLLMPLFALLLARTRFGIYLAILCLAVISFQFQHGTRLISVYLVAFAIGAALLGQVSALRMHWTALAFAFATLTGFRLIAAWPYNDPLPGLVEALAAGMLILGAVEGRLRWLRHRLLTWLGDISYSMYLVHLPVLFFASRGLAQLLPQLSAPGLMMAITITTVAATLALSTAAYHLVERPGIAAGKAFLSWLAARRPAVAATEPR